MGASRPPWITVARSAWLLVASAAALFLFAALTDSVWPQLLGCVVLGFLVTSFVAVARRLRIEVSVELPDRVVVGRAFDTTIVLHTVNARAARALVVRHSWPTSRTLVAAHATFVDRIDRHRDVVMVMTRMPAARGVLGASEVRIDAMAPFGLFSRTMEVLVDRELLVLPTLAPIESIPASVGRDGAAMRAMGTDAGGLREWRFGDQVRSVQWRSTARTGRLTVVDRDQAAVGSLVVLIAGVSGDPALEDAICTAATVCSVALRRATPVLIAGEDGRCVRARTEGSLLELLARADVRELGDAALNRVMRCAGDGGSVLVASGRTGCGVGAPAVRRAAALSGVTVIEMARA